MIGLVAWTRSFTYDKDGKIITNANGPVFAPHPQPNLWKLIAQEAPTWAKTFRSIQLPPVTNGPGEGYSAFCLRNFNSNWGTEPELVDAVAACHKAGMRVGPDLAYRQMTGANKGPGYYVYGNYPGSTTPSWFQNLGQPGATTPPYVQPDDVPDPSGDYAFGDPRSYQHSVPKRVTNEDTLSALKLLYDTLGLNENDEPRWDDGKGMYAPAVLEFLRSINCRCAVEFFSGTISEVYWYVHTLMQNTCQAEDIPGYWPKQRMCNGYDCTQYQPGYWSWDSSNSVGFASNPDVATSWDWYNGGAISQQIAFNLLSAYVVGMNEPHQRFMVYADDYFPADANYPTGKGYKPFIDNLAWFSDTFAIGAFTIVWQDKDVLAFTRNGDGGEYGWSGGCLVIINLNPDVERVMTMYPRIWNPGVWLHDYGVPGGATVRDFEINPDRSINVTMRRNLNSAGQAYCLIAPGGVS